MTGVSEGETFGHMQSSRSSTKYRRDDLMRPLNKSENGTVISSRDNSNVPTSARGDLEHAVSTLFERIVTK